MSRNSKTPETPSCGRGLTNAFLAASNSAGQSLKLIKDELVATGIEVPTWNDVVAMNQVANSLKAVAGFIHDYRFSNDPRTI